MEILKKIVIISDKFKGTLSSSEANTIIELAIRSVFPQCEILKLPVSDGGDGFVRTLTTALKGELKSLSVSDPLGRRIFAEYGILREDKTAIIELASASGLTLLKPKEYNPLLTSTFGTGEIIANAIREGCRKIILGIGGSATNDAGTGLLQALGFQFLDKQKNRLGLGGQILNKIKDIEISQINLPLDKITFQIACDVSNPFYGKDGAASVFALQKGADQEMVKSLDEGLRNFASIIRKTTGIEIQTIPGSGAAGGVGGTLFALLHAELKAGIELILDYLRFDEQIKAADLIITGEGKIDSQTVSGKVIKGITNRAAKQMISVIAFAGILEKNMRLQELGLQFVYNINPPGMSLEEMMNPEIARANLFETAKKVFTETRIS